MILTDREIQSAIFRDQISLDPKPAPGAFSSTSVDLTLDSAARIFRKSTRPDFTIDPGGENFNFHAIVEDLTEKINLDPQYNLEPNNLLLAWTVETLSLPLSSRLAARVEGKSSLARLGVGVHITAPTIHAGFTGQLQLEIVNHGPALVVLRPGMKICQLIFELTLGTPQKGYSGMFSGQKAS